MYVFSTFVMRGLDRTGPVQAITAMRGINAEANANAPSCCRISVRRCSRCCRRSGGGRSSATGPAAAGCWPARCFGIAGAVVTMAFNVPLNNQLDAVDPVGLSAADAAREWQAYLSSWTAWNHVRAATGRGVRGSVADRPARHRWHRLNPVG